MEVGVLFGGLTASLPVGWALPAVVRLCRTKEGAIETPFRQNC